MGTSTSIYSSTDYEEVGAISSHDDTELVFEAKPGLNLVTFGNISAFKDHLPSGFDGGSRGALIGSFLNLKLDFSSKFSCANTIN